MNRRREPLSTDKYYLVPELARCWGLSARILREAFAKDPDVIKWSNNGTGRRAYVMLRIPLVAAQRFYRTRTGREWNPRAA
jgi:hypothetical protein